jgi:hypothetical protein
LKERYVCKCVSAAWENNKSSHEDRHRKSARRRTPSLVRTIAPSEGSIRQSDRVRLSKEVARSPWIRIHVSDKRRLSSQKGNLKLRVEEQPCRRVGLERSLILDHNASGLPRNRTPNTVFTTERHHFPDLNFS